MGFFHTLAIYLDCCVTSYLHLLGFFFLGGGSGHEATLCAAKLYITRDISALLKTPLLPPVNPSLRRLQPLVPSPLLLLCSFPTVVDLESCRIYLFVASVISNTRLKFIQPRMVAHAGNHSAQEAKAEEEVWGQTLLHTETLFQQAGPAGAGGS